MEAQSLLERLSGIEALAEYDARALREAGSDVLARIEALETSAACRVERGHVAGGHATPGLVEERLAAYR